jgi:hypothetical protein
LGIDDNHLFDFLKKLYNERKEQRLLPADIIRLVNGINAYPEEINSLNDIPKNIKKRRQEKTKLDTDIFYKKLEIQKLDHEKETKRKEIQDLHDDLESFRKKTQNEKTDFFRCMNYYFNDLLTLQQDIFEKQDEVPILDDEISLKRKVIKESQPIVFSILQNLINTGLNEHDILMFFKIFEIDWCNNMIYDNRTYLEHLSKDLNKYPSVRDTLIGLNNKILLKKSYIENWQ